MQGGSKKSVDAILLKSVKYNHSIETFWAFERYYPSVLPRKRLLWLFSLLTTFFSVIIQVEIILFGELVYQECKDRWSHAPEGEKRDQTGHPKDIFR